MITDVKGRKLASVPPWNTKQLTVFEGDIQEKAMEILARQYGRWEVAVRGKEVWVYATVLPVPTGKTFRCAVCGAEGEVFQDSVDFDKIIEANTEDWPVRLTKKEKVVLADLILGEMLADEPQGCHECSDRLNYIKSIEEGTCLS